jgi:hypothetical protein
MVTFSGAARRLTAADVEAVADRLGCEVAALRAVLAVESKGAGFDSKRRPIILFEPHVFYRNLPPGSDKQRRAVSQGLAYKSWGAKPYPAGQDAQYTRLAAAMKIDEEAAFRAISVGLGQVLGENFRICGFGSAVELFEDAKESEGNQLGHMAGFIRSKRIDDDLREKRWEQFARVYNGPGQVPKYSKWLAREYAKWKKIEAVPRERLTAAELKAAGSKTIQGTSRAKAALVSAGAAAAGAREMADNVQSVVTPFADAAAHVHSASSAYEWASNNWQAVGFIALSALVVFFLWQIWDGIQQAEQARVEDARDGLNARF